MTQPIDAMNFSHALSALKEGKKVSRAGWNGKGMWLYLVPANAYPAQTQAAKDYWKDKQPTVIPESSANVVLVPYGAYIAMKTVQENVVPWLASQTDVLADDWGIV